MQNEAVVSVLPEGGLEKLVQLILMTLTASYSSGKVYRGRRNGQHVEMTMI
jgi:hypothetical protein